MLEKDLRDLYDKIPGKAGFYYKDLVTGQVIDFNSKTLMYSASIIKLPILIEALGQIEAGLRSKDDRIIVKNEYKVPSCGAISYMHEGLEVTLEDLYSLMIILSDNTASNMVMNIIGIEKVNERLKSLGCLGSVLGRNFYDMENLDKKNQATAYDMAIILESIYRGECISKEVSEEIIRILKLQLMDSKLPYLLPEEVEIAHKTGEDSTISHDVGIVYSERPFIFAFTSNETFVPEAEDSLRKMAKLCYENSLK